MRGLDADLKLNKPELKVTFDRAKIADVGTDVKTIGQTLATMLGGRKVTRYRRDGEAYEVIVPVDNVDRPDPHDSPSIFVRRPPGPMALLSKLLARLACRGARM